MAVTAKFASGKNGLPNGANPAGYEANRESLYVARAQIGGGFHLGKYKRGWKQAAFPYGGKELWVSDFEIWVGKLSNNYVGSWSRHDLHRDDTVACGNEANGTPLYIARAKHEGGLHRGKWRKDWKQAAISYGGLEIWKSDFEVLVSSVILAEPQGHGVDE